VSTLAGSATLIRFVLRRDRVRLPVWIAGIALLVLSTASSVEGLYPTAEALANAAAVVGENSAVIAMNGPTHGIETLGGRTVFEVGAFGYVIVALMNMFLVIRHTRAEEESGRAELVRATVVGRHAAVTAILVVAGAANLVIGVIVTCGLAAMDLPSAGCVAFGAALTCCGLAFAGVAAVAAQLTENVRPAYGLTAAVIGVAYVLRAVGDVGTGALSWLSPIGWGQAIRAFAGERWWVLILPLTATVLLVAAAFALASRRDLGAGLVRSRPGRAAASATLQRPAGFALRLQRGTLIGWVVGLFLGGVAYGSIGNDVADLIGDNEAMSDLMAQAGGDLTDSYFATIMLMLALISTGFAVQSTLRLRGEETAGRAEPLLATALSRMRWAASHLLIATLGAVALLVAAGLGAGLAYGLTADDFGQVPRLVGAALAHVPAVWVLVGVALMLFGFVPRAVAAAWGAVAVCFVVGFFGQLLDLPNWLRDLSPFQHVPALPAAGFRTTPLLILLAIAAVLVAVGLVGFRRRDVG
jgi:ABC-2 type transport system permease protein